MESETILFAIMLKVLYEKRGSNQSNRLLTAVGQSFIKKTGGTYHTEECDASSRAVCGQRGHRPGRTQ